MTPPKVDPRKVVPWTRDQVLAIRAALPKRFRVAVDVASGCGHRQGEVFGLAVDDVDFLRGWVHINRQIKAVRSRLVFALPKGRKTRKVPLSKELGFLLAAHIEEFPPVEVTLPWEVSTGDPVTVKLLVHTSAKTAVSRSSYNPRIWKSAREAAGLEDSRTNGMHALRHFYVSVLLDAGENIRALSEYLGHSDPGFTLRTYTHLMPASETRARKAIDAMLRGDVKDPDGLATAYEGQYCRYRSSTRLPRSEVGLLTTFASRKRGIPLYRPRTTRGTRPEQHRAGRRSGLGRGHGWAP